MKKQLNLTILLITLLLSSCTSPNKTCTAKPDVEANPNGQTIKEQILPKATLQCDF